jgi:membrane associated rhomboid family serine protease
MLAIRAGLHGLITDLELAPHAVFSGQVWRLLSYTLLHQGVGHLVSNLLLFYFFGADIERQLGPRKLLIICAAGAIGGGVMVCLGAATGIASGAPVIGASGAGLALLTAWCLLHARRVINLFGILPLNGQQLLFLAAGLEVLMAVTPGPASSAAHLGGMISGWLVISGIWRPRRIRQRLRLLALRRKMRRNRPKEFNVLRGGKAPKDKDWLN